jgi:hypothetical protein
MSGGESIRLVCYRWESENIRTPRQALHFFRQEALDHLETRATRLSEV